jgi:hypothetical protein
MNKKVLVLIVLITLIAFVIPIIDTTAIKPQPKIMIRLDTPLVITDPGTSELNGDKIVFKDQVFTEGPWDEEVRLMIFVWQINPDPPPSHLPPPGPGNWPAPMMVCSPGTVYATTHGIRDAYTMTGKWHMDFTVTFMVNDVESGFEFRHDCTGVGLIHAASWGGEGFGVFEGVKVSGASVIDLYEGMQNPPLSKTMWGVVSSGFDVITSLAP